MDGEQIKAETKERLGETAEKAKARGWEAKEKVKDIYESARDQVKETMEGLKGKNFDDIVDDVSGYVKENPGRFLLITFGLGLAAGLMLRNSKNHKDEQQF